jgi:hypothetical protein
MRNASERLGTPSIQPHRQVQAERLLPALQRTSRYRFHEDDPERSSDNSRTARYREPDSDVEGES